MTIVAALWLTVQIVWPGSIAIGIVSPVSASPEIQNVVSRLWEDPLEAVNNSALYISALANRSGYSSTNLAQNISARAGPLRILLVPVPETPFPTDHEQRLRNRYSIQLALAHEDFVPEDPNHLGFFFWPPTTNPTNGPSSFAAYEFYQRPNSSVPAKADALVIWFPQNLLQSKPLDIIQELYTKLLPEPTNQMKFNKLFLIGPPSSDSLKSLISDARDKINQGPASFATNFVILSPRATAADTLIGLTQQTNWQSARNGIEQPLRKYLNRNNDNSERIFYNCIATDDQLTDLLVNELSIRDIKFGDSTPAENTSNTILILTEADTTYGRSLPLTFKTSIQKFIELHKRKTRSLLRHSVSPVHYWESVESETTDTPSSTNKSQLLIYQFMSGLDRYKGSAANERKSPSVAAPSVDEVVGNLIHRRSPYLSSPLGESQLDYAERLADEIANWEDSQQIKAVGVFGNDVNDKLILLKSLRYRFPSAVFFTTDLDAQMWSQDWISTTRNMIVASSYDVKIDPDDTPNGEIPPFRDTYQVALFRAVRAALQKPTNSYHFPQLFEIGRRVPVPLSIESPIQTRRSRRRLLIGSHDIGNFGAGLFAASIAVCGLLWMVAIRAYYRSQFRLLTHYLIAQVSGKSSRYPYARFALLGLIPIFFLVFLGDLWLFNEPNEEPWAWNLGISVWPTELIRLIIMVVVPVSLIWAWNHHVKTRAKLIRKYRLNVNLGAFVSKVGSRNADCIFSDYYARAERYPRMIRVSLMIVIYCLIVTAIGMFVGASLPYRPFIRGVATRWIDGFVILVSALFMLCLVTYVLDAFVLTARMFRKFRGKTTVWPSELVHETCTEFSVREGDVAGLLDVRFAADKSMDTGALVVLPVVLQVLFFLSQIPYFNGSEESALVSLLLGTDLLFVFIAWFVLREAARQLKTEAMEAVDKAIYNSKMNLRVRGKTNREVKRFHGLRQLREEIIGEERGAFAKVFQDPSILVMVLPASAYGILFIVLNSIFQ